MKKALLVLLLLFAPSAWATNLVYISQNGAGAQDGTSCATAKPATYFNASSNWSGSPTGVQIGPDTTVHLCGTWTGTAGSGMLTFQGSGTVGHPITVVAEAGFTASAPYWSASAGFINASGRSNITLDGSASGSAVATLGTGYGTFGAVGTIQNTANGEGMANRQITTLIYAPNCNNCTIKNWNLSNVYITTKNTPNPVGGIVTQMSAITYSGQGGLITNNIIHDCGWCILDSYANNDTGLEISFNKIWNYDHGLMFAAASAVAATSPALRFHDNQILDNQNWENTIAGGSSSDCPYHLDGIHIFGTTGNTIDGVYVYNNYFGGAVSGCSTGFIFVENGGSPSHVLNSAWWNNVFDATGSDTITIPGCTNCGDVGGWVQIFSSQTSILFVNNTTIYKNALDGGAQSYNIGSVTNLTMKNNVSNGFNMGNNVGSLASTPAGQVDRNFYGSACTLSNNCFIYNQTFRQSFAGWKSASGFDTNGNVSTFSGALLGAQGSPLSGSPVLTLGANLSTTATGLLATLQNDTTLGGSRTPLARPTGVTAWAAGAYQLAGSITPASVPTGLTASVTNTTGNLSWSVSSGTAPITYNVSRGTTSGGPYTLIISGLSGTSYADTNLSAGTYYWVVSATNAAGTSANSTQASGTVTPSVVPPGAPASLSATVSGTSVSLLWAQSLGTPTNYVVKRATVSGGPYTTIATLGLVTTYTDTGLANGTYYYVVAATNSAGSSANSPQASALVVTAAAANLAPGAQFFGTIIVGQTGGCGAASCTVTVSSTGTANLVLAGSNAVTLSGANAADFAISANTCTNGLSMTPGATCSVTLTASPSIVGNETASLVVVSNDPSSPDSVPLSVTGQAAYTISPTSLSFGNTFINKTSSARSVTFSNTSGSTITFSSIALTTGTQFTISSNTCGGSVANGAICTVSMTFSPTSTGNKTDTLTFTFSGASGSPQTVALSGNGKRHGVLRVGSAVRWPSYGVTFKTAILIEPWHPRSFFAGEI